MVFVVKSAISNFDRRQAIRQTWGNVKMYNGVMFETVFVVGKTTDHKLMEQIGEENIQHGDILQLELNDIPEYEHF